LLDSLATLLARGEEKPQISQAFLDVTPVACEQPQRRAASLCSTRKTATWA
jgi:hypothetical protein